MRPTQFYRSGGAGKHGEYGKYLGEWGALGSQTQKGVAAYALSANRQRPLAGTAHAAIFNVWRRFSAQVLYFAPPLIIAYSAMQWAVERNHYLNSKAGIAEFSQDEE